MRDKDCDGSEKVEEIGKMTKNCSRCIFNETLYRERKIGLKKKDFDAKTIILKGAVATEHAPISKDIWIFISKKDLPKKIYFSGKARLSFDSFLSDEDYKRTPEENLREYNYEGRIELIGKEATDKKDWLYKIHGDFDETLPLLLFNEVQLRISPLESKIRKVSPHIPPSSNFIDFVAYAILISLAINYLSFL